MNEYIILYDKSGALDVTSASHAVESVTKTLLYEGQCMYLPFPGREKGKVILLIDPNDATESETDWFLRRLAGYLGAVALTPDGDALFSDSDDNDTAFLDTVPPPESESLPIRLTAEINGIDENMTAENYVRFFDELGYEVNEENDGFSVYVATNSFLDVFLVPAQNKMTLEMDCTFSGAGIYAEAFELIKDFAKQFKYEASFFESDGITYTDDLDFDKLRKKFYDICSQHLAFALLDDRDGYQAYFGWGTDSFEPEHIPGSLVTPLGRYEISRIISDIEAYGFSYVCDCYFLACNSPCRGADYYIKDAMHVMWSSSFTARDSDFSMIDYITADQCLTSFNEALKSDPFVRFPTDAYRRVCTLTGKEMSDTSKTRPYDFHYDIGYMNGGVCYGFGHYLRRFKLPGRLTRNLAPRGENVVFFGSTADGIRIECEVNYGFSGDISISPLGKNYALGDTDDIEIFDIGGSSVVRFIDGGTSDGACKAEAEVYIRDEVYRFAMFCLYHDDILWFRDVLKECQNVEDWYDDYNFDGMPDPHANGATFCMNIIKPPCTAFKLPFPRTHEFFIAPSVVPFPITKRAIDEYESRDFLNYSGIDFDKILGDFLKIAGIQSGGVLNIDEFIDPDDEDDSNDTENDADTDRRETE